MIANFPRPRSPCLLKRHSKWSEREFSEHDFTRAVENNGFVTAVLLLISDNNGKPEQKIWRNERGIERGRKKETDGEGWRRLVFHNAWGRRISGSL